jgi:tripartite-type tricarboxylate transporter receptor subunit TctC
MKRRSLALALALVMVTTMLFAACGGTAPAAKYPSRPIQAIVPFGAGGGTDLWNRAIMEAMSESWGQTILVSNMTGGSAGSIGVDYVWKAPHDGYVLAGTSETPLTIPVMTGLKQTAKDWDYYIAAGSPGVLCVNKNSQYKSFDDILAALKANKESASIAGTSGGLWFALASLFAAYGEVPFKWVPYDGSGPAIKGAVANEADCVVASAGEVKDFVASGDLIPIAIMGLEDWEFPGFGKVEAVVKKVPALASKLPMNQWLGFKVPSDTPDAIKKELETAFKKAMDSQKIKDFATAQNAVIFNLTGQAAKDMAKAAEANLCWTLFEMGKTKFSPEEFGIAKPGAK